MEVVGRESEFAVVDEFLTGDSSTGALVLTGGPGIGKTTLWDAGIGLAREHGWRVLSARPSSAEAQLSFGALTDLCHGLDEQALAGLPPPQRVALEVALLRAEPPRLAPGQHAVGLG